MLIPTYGYVIIQFQDDNIYEITHKCSKAKVIAIHPDQLEYTIGDIVYIIPGTGYEITIQDKTYFIVHFSQIVAMDQTSE